VVFDKSSTSIGPTSHQGAPSCEHHLEEPFFVSFQDTFNLLQLYSACFLKKQSRYLAESERVKSMEAAANFEQ
jgi:hypothetical protein